MVELVAWSACLSEKHICFELRVVLASWFYFFCISARVICIFDIRVFLSVRRIRKGFPRVRTYQQPYWLYSDVMDVVFSLVSFPVSFRLIDDSSKNKNHANGWYCGGRCNLLQHTSLNGRFSKSAMAMSCTLGLRRISQISFVNV